MKLLRRPAFLAAAATCAILALYFALVANRAVIFIRTGDVVAIVIGYALLVFPALGLWWLVQEWRLGSVVQKMANRLEDDGRLPIHDGETLPSGKLTEESAKAVFEVARRGIEDRPDDWSAWFHVAYAYEASGDRSMARRSLRHAAELFRKLRADISR